MSLWNSIVGTVSEARVSAGGSNASAYDAGVRVLEKIGHPIVEMFHAERGMVLTKAGAVDVDAKRAKNGENKTNSTSAIRKGISKLVFSDDKAESKGLVAGMLKAWDLAAALNWAVNGDCASKVGTIDN